MKQLVSRKQAKTLGLATYFTGVPCKHGHLIERHTKSSCCVTCRVMQSAKHNANNREKKTLRKRELRIDRSLERRLREALHNAKARAKTKNMVFDSTLMNTLLVEVPLNCPCCNSAFNTLSFRTGAGCRDQAISLDRLRNNEGYTLQNTRIICFRCNRIKNNSSVKDLQNILSWLLKEGLTS